MAPPRTVAITTIAPLVLAVLALAVPSPAHAARVGVGAGVEAVMNDPFVYRRGARAGLSVALRDPVELAFVLGWYPILGQGGCDDPDWTPLACDLLTEASVVPDISKLAWQGQATLRLLPLRAPIGDGWYTATGLLAGFGVIGTQDDLVALQDMGTSAVSTQVQIHPTSVTGWLGEVRDAHLGVRFRIETVAYIEVTGGGNLELKQNVFGGGEVMWWF